MGLSIKLFRIDWSDTWIWSIEDRQIQWRTGFHGMLARHPIRWRAEGADKRAQGSHRCCRLYDWRTDFDGRQSRRRHLLSRKWAPTLFKSSAIPLICVGFFSSFARWLCSSSRLRVRRGIYDVRRCSFHSWRPRCVLTFSHRNRVFKRRVFFSIGVRDDTGAIADVLTDKYLDGFLLGNFTEMIPGLMDVSTDFGPQLKSNLLNKLLFHRWPLRCSWKLEVGRLWSSTLSTAPNLIGILTITEPNSRSWVPRLLSRKVIQRLSGPLSNGPDPYFVSSNERCLSFLRYQSRRRVAQLFLHEPRHERRRDQIIQTNDATVDQFRRLRVRLTASLRSPRTT